MSDNTPILGIRVDDGYSHWLTAHAAFGGISAWEYFARNEIPFTLAVVPTFTLGAHPGSGVTLQSSAYAALEGANFVAHQNADTWGARVSFDKIREMLRRNPNFEIAAHSMNHAADDAASNAGGRGADTAAVYYDKEWRKSKALIEEVIPGYRVRGGIEPGPHKTKFGDVRSFAKIDGDPGYNIRNQFDWFMGYMGGFFRIGRQHYKYGYTNNGWLDHYTTAPSDDQINILDVVSETPGMCWVTYWHDIDTAEEGTDYTVDPWFLRRFLDKAFQLQAEGKLRICNISQMYENAENFDRTGLNYTFQDGEFENVLFPNDLNLYTSSGDAASFVEGGGVDGGTALYVSIDCTLPIVNLEPGSYEISYWMRNETGYSNLIQQGANITVYQSWLWDTLSETLTAMWSGASLSTDWQFFSRRFTVPERTTLRLLASAGADMEDEFTGVNVPAYFDKIRVVRV